MGDDGMNGDRNHQLSLVYPIGPLGNRVFGRWLAVILLIRWQRNLKRSPGQMFRMREKQ
jgi:hypothetical protein